MVRKFYSVGLKAWIGDLGDGTHDGGPEDPRIGVIRVKAVTATYAISSKTQVGQFVEFAKGVATGDAPSVNKLRKLSEAEIEQCKWRPQIKSCCNEGASVADFCDIRAREPSVSVA